MSCFAFSMNMSPGGALVARFMAIFDPKWTTLWTYPPSYALPLRMTRAYDRTPPHTQPYEGDMITGYAMDL